MEEALNGLPVDVSHQISGSKAGIERRRSAINLHNEVVHGVEIGVAEVDPDGPDGEAEPPRPSPDNDGRVEAVDQR